MRFWKVGSRKIYAVQRDTKGKLPHKKVFTDTESEDDFEPPRKKRHSESGCIVSEIRDMRKDLQSLFEISKSLKLPLGLHKQLQDAFRCSICCCSPIKPPVIFGRCCKRLLGCQNCVDRWFGGEDGVTRSCSLCRAERAYADTCILKGLDELLTSISPLMSSSTEDSDREDSPIQQ